MVFRSGLLWQWLEKQPIDAEVLGKGRKLKREDAVSTFTTIFNTQFRL